MIIPLENTMKILARLVKLFNRRRSRSAHLDLEGSILPMVAEVDQLAEDKNDAARIARWRKNPQLLKLYQAMDLAG